MRVTLASEMGTVSVDNVDVVVGGEPLHLVKGNIHTLIVTVKNDDGTAFSVANRTGLLFISGKSDVTSSTYKFNYSGANITETNLAGGVFTRTLATGDLDAVYNDFVIEVGYLSGSDPVAYGIYHTKVVRGTRA